jgi:hypothetical protein
VGPDPGRYSRKEAADRELKDGEIQLLLDDEVVHPELGLPGGVDAKDALERARGDLDCIYTKEMAVKTWLRKRYKASLRVRLLQNYYLIWLSILLSGHVPVLDNLMH